MLSAGLLQRLTRIQRIQQIYPVEISICLIRCVCVRYIIIILWNLWDLCEVRCVGELGEAGGGEGEEGNAYVGDVTQAFSTTEQRGTCGDHIVDNHHMLACERFICFGD